ncbi:MAG: DNA-3-methyladenine glycosylase family protein [Thermoplasmatota archaeon]
MTTDPLLDALTRARGHWAKHEPVMARLSRASRLPAPAFRGSDQDGFASLLQSITHQQVSLAAGRAIFSRVEAATGATPRGVLAAGTEKLRAAGLSQQKARYALDLAAHVEEGRLDFSRFPKMSDADVIAALTDVNGIGVWTAKMFLLFHLARADVLPFEDLGCQIAVARAYRVPAKRAAAKMRALGPKWSPYNSLAALTLWHWRHLDDARRAKRAPVTAATIKAKRAAPRAP